MSSLTDVFVAVKSDMSPFEKGTKSGLASAGKQFERSGRNVGKMFADAASAAAKSKIEDLGKKASAAADASADAVGKLRVAETKLAEVRKNAKAKASQIAAAEEAVATAQRKSAAAAKSAEAATEALTKARQAATAKALQAGDQDAERKGSESGKRFGLGFSKSIPALGGRVSGMMSTGLQGAAGAALAGGAILGAALITGFKEALEQGDVKAMFQAQLGLGDAEAAKAGKAAGDLYKANYGESLAGVNDAIKSVVQNTNVSLNSVDLKPVTAKVLNLASVFDQDLGAVTRATGQLIRTGLAKDATQALDIITKGFQSGADKSEDFLDTLNEYGTQFRKVGIDGATATGIISQGLKAGARDADIVADAIKEFSIRAVDGSKTTSEGFKALGLNAEKMSQQIAKGGRPAAAGLDLVMDRLRRIKDPVKQSQIAVQLFGTQAEDLGKALFAIDPSTAVKGIGQVAGAAERMDKTLGATPQARVSSFFRTLKQGAVESLGGVINAFATGKTSATGFQGELEKAAVWLQQNKYQIAAVFVDITKGAVGLAKNVLPVVKTLDKGFRDWLGGMLQSAAKAFGWIPEVGPRLQKASQSFNSYSTGVDKAFDIAIKKAGEWDTALDKTSKELHLKADISNLENNLKAAKASLADKNLTKERRAEITANIKDLQQKLAAAKSRAMLASPDLVKARIAKLDADKRSLDKKIADAKTALKSKDLTKERAAKLNADIRALLQKKTQAQRAIDSLRGKTVSVELKFTSAGVNLSAPSSVGRRAFGGPGGPVKGPGTTTSDTAGLFALSRKEWVIKAASSQKYGEKAMASINAGTATVIPGMATGGPVWPAFDKRYNSAVQRGAKMFSSGYSSPYGRALGFAQSQAGKPYVWGGVGPGGYDCSGFMSAITNVIRGRAPYSRVGATGSFPWSGFRRGGGLFSIGSFRGNPGHMAGTLLGVDVESRGGEGVVVGSRARGARSAMFGGNVWGMATGGKVGDLPFDLIDPRGKNFQGRDFLEALGIDNFDTGGRWRSGTLGYNGSGKTETVIPGDGAIELGPKTMRELATILRGALAVDGRSLDTALTRSTLGRGY